VSVTAEQALRLRNWFWLQDHEVGRLFPDGRVRRMSARSLARLHGVDEGTVRHALKAARRECEAVRDAQGDW
jgi:hypothetical protein